MNYKIVKDEKLLREFIEWLPDLKETEKYYLCLFARNKYCKELTHIKSDKAQLKRFVSDKERMFQKIKQLEIEVGWYQQKHMAVPEEALALYITPNPRDMYKAAINTMVKLANSVRDQNIAMNVHQEALSEIQKSKSRTCWVDFDMDTKEESLTREMFKIAKQLVTHPTIIETRGGYHFLIDPEKVNPEYETKWYQMLAKYADQTGDNMIPVPGCTQGMFIPHFIKL
jgi:hypothetical protein